MMLNRYIVLLGLLMSAKLMWSQSTHHTIQLITEISEVFHFPDTASAVPGSLVLIFFPGGDTVGSHQYTYTSHTLVLTDSLLHGKVFSLHYLPLPSILAEPYQHKAKSLIGFEFEAYDPAAVYVAPITGQRGTEFSNLEYSGSFVRGVSFGNNQNLVLNSSFNLQLSGMLSDDVEVMASITDNNIPVQPEGNTRQLQDFDKIFIQLSRGETKLLAGDYELTDPGAYFLRHYKKMQGLRLSHRFIWDDDRSLEINAGAALSRGRFTVNNIRGMEGNQGPYRLTGAEGEKFIIILAGTERVFVDEKLLTRGQQYDYVIDYNRGEITFTSRKFITAYSRIRIEFEYTEQAYLRSSAASGATYRSPDFTVYGHFFTEQDNRNTSGVQDLSPAQRQLLAQLGDSAADALVSGIDTLEGGFNPERIMYRLTDTMVNGVLYEQVLVYSTNEDDAHYVARFTDVGEGNGHYIRTSSLANGAVFAWVAPDSLTGMPSGRYEPLQRLIAPRRQRMIAGGGAWHPDQRTEVKLELALSDLDNNTFSSRDAADNTGYAVRSAWRRDLIHSVDTAGAQQWVLSWHGAYEYVHRHFNQVNPFRERDFARQWTLDDAFGNEFHWLRTGLSLGYLDVVNAQYQINSLTFGRSFRGLMHEWSASWQTDDIEANTHGAMMQADEDGAANSLFRPYLSLAGRIPGTLNTRLGVIAEREQITLTDSLTSDLLPASLYFDRMEVFMSQEMSAVSALRLSYIRRADYAPEGESFDRASMADEFQARWNLNTGPSYQFSFFGHFRDLKVSNADFAGTSSARHFLGRFEQQFNAWSGLLRGNTTYELGAGQEPRLDFNYIQVNPGEGIYIWIDRNGDGIKQTDEFEIGLYPDEADHIRVVIISDEFVTVRSMQWNQSLAVHPASVIRAGQGLRDVLRRFILQSLFQINRKVQPVEGVAIYNPFESNIPDTALVSVSSNQRHVLHFNRDHPRWGIELGYGQASSGMLLSTGLEKRSRYEPFMKIRAGFTRWHTLHLEMAVPRRSLIAEQGLNRNYDLEVFRIHPELSWLMSNVMRLNAGYSFEHLVNSPEYGGESAAKHDFSLQYQLSSVGRASVRTGFTFASVQYEGVQGTAVEFAMLEGLRSGNNFLWNIAFDRRIAGNIMLSLGYEGRKTGLSPLVHTGRAQVRATF